MRDHLEPGQKNVKNEPLVEGIFIGPQIRELLVDQKFDEIIKGDKKNALNAFRQVVYNFLGNKSSENYRDIVANMFSAYEI